MLILLGQGLQQSDLPWLCERNGCQTAQVVRFDGAQILLREANGEEWALTQPDMLCLGLLHAAADEDIVAPLRDWWLQKSGVPLACCPLAAGQPEQSRRLAAAEWIAERLAELVDLLGAENKNILNQNRMLRKSYGSLQTAFGRVEQFVAANGLQAPILQYEPQRLASFQLPAHRGDKLTQVLPVLSSRLSHFELNFQKPQQAGPGTLHIALRLEPAGRVLQEWLVEYRDVLEGWNGFSPAALVDEPNEVMLECLWSEVVGAPAVGMSPPHWETPYAALPRAAAGPWPSIGARIWSGLAGVRPPRLANAPRARGQAQDRFRALSHDELIGATQHKFAVTIERDYPSVRYLDKPGRLLVHPHADVPTIAMLPSPLPPGTARVSADIRAAIAEAPDIAYAMAALPPEISPVDVFTGGDEPAPGFSGWHLLQAAQARRIGAVLAAPAQNGMRLFLATRLRDRSSEAGAWATWGAIEIDHEPPSAERAGKAAAGRAEAEPAPPRNGASNGSRPGKGVAMRGRAAAAAPVAPEP